jgi:hypothetical protein
MEILARNEREVKMTYPTATGGFFSECVCNHPYAIIQSGTAADAIEKQMGASMDVFRAGTGEQRCSVCDMPIFTPQTELLDADRNPIVREVIDNLFPGEFDAGDFDQWTP